MLSRVLTTAKKISRKNTVRPPINAAIARTNKAAIPKEKLAPAMAPTKPAAMSKPTEVYCQ